MARRERADGAETRQRILRAAEALFAEQGLAGTGMREIARRAGVNAALPYHHFGGKEALYFEVVSGFGAELGSVVGVLLEASGPAGDPLDRAVDALLDVMRRNHRLVRILVREVMAPSPAWVNASGRSIGPVLDAVDAIVRQGVAAGTLRPANGRVLGVLVFGCIAYWVAAHESLSALLGADPLDGPLYEQVRAEVKALLRARLGLEASP